jgi:RNA polymerase sigma-70 factor (ECF subfamily)
MKGWLKEKLLLLRLSKKDPDAFGEIYDLYVSKIYRFIYFKVSSVEEAEDLTSEVFLKTWQYVSDGKEIENLNAMLYKIARNIVIDFYRDRAKKEILEEELLVKAEVKKDELKKLQINLDLKDIEESLRELKDEYREIIILRFIEELSISEIALILEKSKGAVRVLIFRALETLKEVLERKEK